TTLVCQNGSGLLAGCTNIYAQTNDTTNFIRNQTAAQTGNFNVFASSNVAAQIRGASGQDIAQFQNNATGAVVASIDGTGKLTSTGITSAGAAVSLNDNSNFNTSINTGTSTGTVSIGSTSNTGFTVEAGTTATLFNSASAHTLQFATGAATQAVTIGSNNVNSTLALQGGSSVTIAGPTTINGGSSTASTTIGNTSAGAFSLLSGANSAISAGATHTLQVTSSNFNVATTGAVTAGTYNGITVASAADGFTLAGGTASRTLTVTGADITIGSTIKPTSTGALTVQSNGTNTLTLDAGGPSTVELGRTNASGVNIGKGGNPTTNYGSFTSQQLLTGQLGLTITGAAASINDSSNFNTSINGGTSTGTVSIGNTATTGFSLENNGGNTTALFNGGTAHAIQFATGAAAQTVTIGSTNTSSTLALQGGSSVTIAGPTTINGGSSTSSTTIGNSSAGAFSLLSGANSSISAGATHTLQVTSSNFNVATTGAVTAGTYNGITVASAADGFTLAGGTTSRTLTVTGADITVGNTIKPTSAGTLAVQSNGANTLTLDTGGANSIQIGSTNANSVTIGNSTNSTAVSINGGTGALGIGTDAFARTISIGTGAATQTVNIGSTNSGVTTLQSAGGILVKGASNIFDNTPGATSTSSLVRFGPNAIASGSASGTYLGVNQTTGATADFLNFQVNGTYKLKVDSTGLVSTAQGFAVGATTGGTYTCSSGQILTGANYAGGIAATGGTCSSPSGFVTLQNAYDNSGTSAPQITLSSTYGGLKIYDNATPLGASLFTVANGNGTPGTTKYFDVTASQISTAGVLNVNGTGTTTIAGKLDLTNTTNSLSAAGPVVITGSTGVLKVGSSNQFQVNATGDVSTTTTLTVGTTGGANPEYLVVDSGGRATFTYNGSSNADVASFIINNKNAGGGTSTISASTYNLAGVTNASGTNITNALNFNSIASAPITGNTFRGLYFGTGYNDILNYNGNQLISGTGKLQNFAVDSTVNYSNLTQVGALVGGSIAGGFGDIIQTGTSRIQTAASIKGDSLAIGTSSYNKFTVDNSGNVVEVGSLTHGVTGQLIIDSSGNYSSSGSLFLTGNGSTGTQLKVSGVPSSSTTQPLVQFGAALSGGSANGTWLGIGAGTSTADLLNLQVGAVPASVFKVTNTGALTASSTAQFGGNISNTAGTVSGAAGFLYNGSANTTGFVLRSNGTAYVGAAIQGSDGAGQFIRNTPAATSDNIIMPTAAAIVSLTVKGANVASAANTLEVYNSGTTQNLQAYFDSTGALFLNQRLNASSVVDVGTSGARFGTGYFTSSSTTTGLDVSGTVLSVNQLQFANSANATISVAQSTGATAGRNVSISAGAGGSTGAVGGNLSLTAGAGTGSGQNGGDTTIDGGASGGGAGTKGAVKIQGGGGNVVIGTNTVTATNTVEIASTPTSAAGGNALKVGSTLTDAADNANTFNGIQGGITAGGSGVNYTGSLFGGNFSAVFASGTASKTASAIYGLQGGVTHNSTQATDAVTNAYGGNFTVTNSNVGTIGTAYGVNAGVIKSGNGVITTAYGLYTKLQNTNATGAITTGYGVYVDVPVTTGAITNFYSGIFRGGNVGIGVTAPAGLLSVGAGAGTNGAFQVDNNGNLIVGQTVTGNADVTVQAGGATNNLSLKATGTATALLDTTGAGTVTIGATATAIGIGSTSTARSISIGNNTGSTGLNLTAGSNGLVATSTAGASLTAGAASTAALDTGASGTINIGTSNNSKTIQIGSTANAVTQTIGIGNNSTAASVTNTTIGGTTTGSTLILQGINTKTTYDSLGLANKATTDTSSAFTIQNSVGAGLFTVNTTNSNSGTNLMTNGGIESLTGWSAYGAATANLANAANEFISGVAGGKATLSGASSGLKGTTSALAASTTYLISFTAKAAAGSASDYAAAILFNSTSVDAGTGAVNGCTSLTITTTFQKFSCTFTTGSTNTFTSPSLAIYEVGTTGTTLYVDNVSIIAQTATNTLTVSQVKLGGAAGQGLSLLTLDTFAGRPTTSSTPNSALLGSMYYDTTLGKMQCYEATGWGYCGASPDVSVNLVPEYTGAVLNGSGIGSLTSDLCANVGAFTGGSAINSGVCSTSGDFYNYYNWSTIQPTNQSYSIYIRYQLPATYKSISGNVSLNARRTATTGDDVAFSMYNASGTQCGSTASLSGGSVAANTWAALNITNNCSLVANDIILFKIDVTAVASGGGAAQPVYVSNLSFLAKGQ
ncbi:MAG: exported protein of unknown function, partial [Candidatus Saccharibacteria bacterium]|nr:exported protein of unknown function [Candidatus Saccharibacteria bacterium]